MLKWPQNHSQKKRRNQLMIQAFKTSGHHQLVANEMKKDLDLQASTGSNITPAKMGCKSDQGRPCTHHTITLNSKILDRIRQFLNFSHITQQSGGVHRSSGHGYSIMARNLKQDRWNFLHLGNPKSLQETFDMLKWFL